MTDIGNFEEFTDGCNCGDPLGHHPDCIVGQAKFNGRPTALPSDETLSYRRSILQGADPDSGEPLGRPGWIDAVEEAETAALRQTWFAGLGALHDVYVRFQGSFTGAYAQIGWKDSRCRAADRTQWNKTLLATVRQQEALSGADLAQIRAGAIARLLTTRWETRGHMHPRRLVTDVVRIDDSSLVLRLRPHAADMTYESLAFRRWIACWLHFAWVASPNRRDALAAAAMPDVLVAAQAHPGEPMERPPTRFVRLRHSAMLNIGTDHAAAELSAGTAAFLEGNVVHWPVGRMVAGSWPPLCVESAELADLAGRIRTGGVFTMEFLGEAANANKVAHPQPQPRHFAWTDEPPGERKLRASVAVREPSARVLRNRNTLVDESPKAALLVAKSIRSATQIAAATLPVPGIGKRWIPVSYRRTYPHDDVPAPIAWDKSMAVWLNSTLGILSLLSSGSNPADPHLKDDDIRWMPVPMFSTLQADSLAQVHDDHCATALLRIAEADHDPVRLALDEAVCRALGGDPAEVSTARRLLAAEPALS